MFLQEQLKGIIIISPTDNPPPSAQKSGAGKTRRRVGRRRGGLPSLTRQNLRALVMQSCTPAPGAPPSPWDSAMGAIEDSISQCIFLQITYSNKTHTDTAENPHADGSAAPGARPRFRPMAERKEQLGQLHRGQLLIASYGWTGCSCCP